MGRPREDRAITISVRCVVRRLRALLLDPRGATAAEYAIMASLIAVVIIGAVAAFGGAVNGLFESAAKQMP